MKPLFLFLAVIMLVVLVLFMNRKVQHQKMEGFGIFRDMTNEFTSGQRTYFHDQAGKAILVNEGIALSETSLNNAFKQGDMYLPTSPDRDFSVYFQEDTNKFTEQDFKLCRGVQHPRNLKRAPNVTIGCGWWFVEDPTKPSTAALGFPKRPVDARLGTDYPGGRWIWSLAEAAKREDIKRCKRVRTCDAINAEGIRENCGFCEELGYAVPIDSSGNPKYPDETDAVCPSAIVRSADNCPTTADILKRSGADTPEEIIFDPQTGNEIRTTIPGMITPGLCDPDRRGNLTLDCLISLAKSTGLSDVGIVIRKLKQQSYDLALYKAAKDIVQGVGITVLETNMDRDTAVNLYSRIESAQRNESLKVREAAKYLASGNPNFDVCYYENSDKGPFAVDCLQREFRKARCQLSGKAAPSEVTQGTFTDMTWESVKKGFVNLFQGTRSTDPKIQDKAVLDCIGTMIHRSKPDVCDEQGIEYKVFTSNRVFVGRYISKEGLAKESTLESNANPIAELIQRAGNNAIVTMTTDVTLRSATSIFLDGTIRKNSMVRVSQTTRNPKTKNKESIQTVESMESRDVPFDSSLQYRKYPIYLKAKERNVIYVEYKMDGARGLLTNSEYISQNLPLFQLHKESWKPVFGYDYFGAYTDYALDDATFKPSDNQVGTPSRKALLLNINPFGAGSLYSSNIQTICWMEYLSETGSYPDIFTFTSAGMGGPKFHLGASHLKDEDGIAIGLYSDKGQIYGVVKGADFAKGRWVHYALVMHGDRQGFHLYVNGKPQPRLTARGIKPDDTAVSLTFGGKGFQGGFAWLHVYNYPLTPQEIKRDMNYENPDYVMDVPAVPNVNITDYLVREYEAEDYQGGDYDSLTFNDRNDTKNLETCQNACDKAQQCVAYTFNPSINKCFLKNRLGPRLAYPGATFSAGRIVKDLSIESDWDGNSKCLDILGSNQNDGAEVNTWNCNGLDNQRFAYDDKERLVAKHSGKCLEMDNGSMSIDGRVVQRTCSDVDHQKWILDGSGRIHPKHNPEMCMDLWANQRTTQGGNVVQWNCHEGKNQKWVVRDAQKPTGVVTFYEHCDYFGRAYEFRSGMYTHTTHFKQDDLSSVRIPPGRTVIVYKDGVGGPHGVFTSDIACFTGQKFSDGTDMNDQIRNILVE